MQNSKKRSFTLKDLVVVLVVLLGGYTVWKCWDILYANWLITLASTGLIVALLFFINTKRTSKKEEKKKAKAISLTVTIACALFVVGWFLFPHTTTWWSRINKNGTDSLGYKVNNLTQGRRNTLQMKTVKADSIENANREEKLQILAEIQAQDTIRVIDSLICMQDDRIYNASLHTKEIDSLKAILAARKTNPCQYAQQAAVIDPPPSSVISETKPEIKEEKQVEKEGCSNCPKSGNNKNVEKKGGGLKRIPPPPPTKVQRDTIQPPPPTGGIAYN